MLSDYLHSVFPAPETLGQCLSDPFAEFSFLHVLKCSEGLYEFPKERGAGPAMRGILTGHLCQTDG